MRNSYLKISFFCLGGLLLLLLGALLYFSHRNVQTPNQPERKEPEYLVDTFICDTASILYQADVAPGHPDYDRNVVDKVIKYGYWIPGMSVFLREFEIENYTQPIYAWSEMVPLPVDAGATSVTFGIFKGEPIHIERLYSISSDTIIHIPKDGWEHLGLRRKSAGQYSLSIPANLTGEWRGWLAVCKSDKPNIPDLQHHDGISDPPPDSIYGIWGIGIVQLPEMDTIPRAYILSKMEEFYHKRTTVLDPEECTQQY